MSAKEQVKKEIIEAYVFLRTNNMTISSETLEFMKDSSLKALDQAINCTHSCIDDSKQLVLFANWLQFNSIYSSPKQQVKDFLKEQQKQE